MPLASAIPDMTDAMSALVSDMNSADENVNVGQKWAAVAEAFFKNGLDPAWTPAGLAAGKTAFASAFGTTVSPDPTGAALATALQNGFQAFGALASVPANASPGLPTALIPIVPPPAPPVISTITSPPSDSHEAIINEIHPKLVTWALSGLTSVTTPGGPVPTTPWS